MEDDDYYEYNFYTTIQKKEIETNKLASII